MDRNAAKVMLVDDDSNFRASLSDILNVKGFETVSVRTGKAALAQVGKKIIEVALIDLKLEDMTGLEVLLAIKAHSPDTECILLTGYGTQNLANEAIIAGAYTYFQKPCNMDQLVLSIQRAVEKRAAGKVLQESEARFRTLIENSMDLICILNPDATLRYASPSIEHLLGYTKEDIVVGTGLQDYIHPDDILPFIETFRQHVQASDPSPVSMQLRIRHKDGSWRTLEGTGRNLLENPAVEGIIINARDVTERKLAEEALRLAESNYHSIFEKASVGIFQSTPDGRFLSVNPILARIYGYDSPEDMLASVNDISREIYKDPSERQEFKRLLAEQGEVLDFIGQNYRKDGSLIWTMTNRAYRERCGWKSLVL